MSLVTVFLMRNFCSIVTDGRVSGKNGPESETFKKYLILEDDIVMTTTGNADIFRAVKNYFAKIKSDFSKNFDGQTNHFAWSLYENTLRDFVMNQIPAYKDVDGNQVYQVITLVGKNDQGKFEALGLNYGPNGYKEEKYIPENDEKSFISMAPPEIKGSLVPVFAQMANKRGAGTPQDIVDIQCALQGMVAPQSESVNFNSYGVYMFEQDGKFKEWQSENQH